MNPGLSECRELVKMMPAVYCTVGAYQFDVNSSDFRFVPENSTIGMLAPAGRVVCNVNGQYISRKQWYLPIKPGDIIIYQHIAHGGGGGSNPLRIVLMVVVLVASVYTGGLAAAYFGSTMAGSLAAAAVSIVGNMLINALVPLGPGSGSSTAQIQQPSPTYNASLQGNRARLGSSIPVRYGHELTYPDFASAPYIEFDDNNDQYFCANFVLGIGYYDIIGVYIDDTPIQNFKGIEVVRVGPGQAAVTDSTFPGEDDFTATLETADSRITSSIEIGGQDLVNADWIGPFTAVKSGQTAVAIYYDLIAPRGLGTVANDGTISSRTINFEVAVRPIDYFGRAVGEWTTTDALSISAASSTPQRRSYKTINLPNGSARYQVRMRRTSEKSDNGQHLNDLQWVGLRAQIDAPCGINRTDITGLAVRLKANEQLSQVAQQKIGVIARRLIPVWDSVLETWSAPVATRNPAHAFADILHNGTYGRGLNVNRIDVTTLEELAQLYEDRQDRFDYSYDSRITVDDALRIAARAGRAVPIFRRGAVYTMMRDAQPPGPIALYMPRNMEKDSFTVDYLLPTEETPDAVRLKYRSNKTWEEAVVIGQIYNDYVYAYNENERPVGIPEPSIVQDADLPGIQGNNHALREALYIVADAFYRRVRMSWTTEMEGLLPAYGSAVAIAHDISAWGQSGDFRSVVIDIDGFIDILESADPLNWENEEGEHYIRFIQPNGDVTEALPVINAGGTTFMQLVTPYQGTVYVGESNRERTKFVFGSLSEVTRLVRVIGLRPRSQTTVELAAVLEDDRVHLADLPYLPSPGQSEQDPPNTGGTADPNAGGGTPGSSPVINLSNQNLWITGNMAPSRQNPTVTITFGDDGVLNLAATDYLGIWFTLGDVANQWISPNPVTTVVTDKYEVMFVKYSAWASNGKEIADLTTDGFYVGTYDTWLSMSTDRSFGFAYPSGYTDGTVIQTQINVYIRDAATQENLAITSISADVRTYEPPSP